jgi:hypothetical protein
MTVILLTSIRVWSILSQYCLREWGVADDKTDSIVIKLGEHGVLPLMEVRMSTKVTSRCCRFCMPKYWLLLIVHKRGTSKKDTNSYIVIELNVPELAIYYVPLTVIKVSLGLWSPCIRRDSSICIMPCNPTIASITQLY